MPWRVRPGRCEGKGLACRGRVFRVLRHYSEARNWRRKHGTKKQEWGTRAFWIFAKSSPPPVLNVGVKPRTLNHIKNTDYMENFAQRKPCKNIFSAK